MILPLYELDSPILGEFAKIPIQKPVSSLRSHFEYISHHHHPIRAPRRSKTPDSIVANGPFTDSTLFSERSSLDSPRLRAPSDHPNVFGSPNHHQGAVEPTALASRPPYSDMIRRNRPASSYALTSPHSYPAVVTVQSSVSPPKETSAVSNDPAASVREDPPGVAYKRGKQPGRSQAATAPVPNRATKPRLQSQSNGRPGLHSSGSESKIGYPGKYTNLM